MSDFSRTHRVSQAIQRELAQLIEMEIKDPRLDVVTITGADVTSDFSYAKIYVVVRHDEKAQETLAILNKAAGFLRRRLSREIQLRTTPQLSFHYDQSIRYGQRIDELLKDVNPDESDS